jgi:hypothetical protein
MRTRVLTRRAALTALGAAAFAPAAALAQAPIRFRAVHVDVAPLRASAGDPTAAWVAESLTPALARSLGPYLVPGDRNGATLVARIGNIYLGPSSGGPGPWGQGQDTIEGDLVVHGPHGVVSEVPLRAISSYYPNAVNQTLIVQWNRARIDALAQAFAGWAPRQLGL